MWGAQGWNQWALQPAMFNDVPHEQIDWAALAKQWIQMQQTQPSDPAVPPVIPPVPPPAPASSAVPPPPAVMHPPPPGHSLAPEEFPSEPSVNAPLLKTPVLPGGLPEPFQTERPFENEPAGFGPKPVSNAYWNKTQWETSAANDIDERIWPVPPPIETTAPMIAGKETYDYGHMHDNPPLAMQSIDYNHMSEFSFNQVYPPENQYDQYWTQVNAAPPITPMFLKKEHPPSSATVTPSASLSVEEDTSQIDAAKRKQLPAWIREGLEKMEQERLKKLEKEKAEKEKAEKLAQAALKKDLDLKEASNPLPVKSKFESDSEEDVEEENTSSRRPNIVSKRSPSPIEVIRTEEEKRQEYMLSLRRILTEILLSVTNAEMYAIAEEVIRKEKLKARQLASTASLTSVASGLRGLANYGTESEASDAEEDKDASDSEEELIRRIKEKKRLFAIKEKKILAELERRELEDQNEALKAKNEVLNPVDSEILEPLNSFKDAEKVSPVKEVMPFIPPSDISEQHTSVEIPLINEKVVSSPVEAADNNVTASKEHKKSNDKDSNSSDSSSSSSESGSESSEKNKKKSSKRKQERRDSDRSKNYKKDKSQSKKHHRHSSDSESSDQHRKSRSYDKSSKKSSSYKKKKKYRRSESSSSSSSGFRRRNYASKPESRHNRERRSHSYDDRDRKHRRSVSPKNYRSSRDSHRSRDSYSHRYEKDRYIRREKEHKYYDHKRSPSPYRRSSKLPKKYRSSRSLSSESESSSRKMKKSRIH